VPLAGWALVSARWDVRRFGAVALGLAAAVTTVFLLLAGLVHFAYAGEFALPVARWASELLSL